MSDFGFAAGAARKPDFPRSMIGRPTLPILPAHRELIRKADSASTEALPQAPEHHEDDNVARVRRPVQQAGGDVEWADCENSFDELKNHRGWGGFTMQDLKHCRLLTGSVALMYN